MHIKLVSHTFDVELAAGLYCMYLFVQMYNLTTLKYTYKLSNKIHMDNGKHSCVNVCSYVCTLVDVFLQKYLLQYSFNVCNMTLMIKLFLHINTISHDYKINIHMCTFLQRAI